LTRPAFTRRLRSDPRELELLLPALSAFLAQHDVEATVTYVVELTAEELLLNVMKHAYHGDATRVVGLHIELISSSEATLEVDDDGEPFDPRQLPGPDFDDILHGERVGGLGVHLVRSLAASLDYERIDNRNHVRVRVLPLVTPGS